MSPTSEAPTTSVPPCDVPIKIKYRFHNGLHVRKSENIWQAVVD